jgi:ficolin
MTYNNGGKFSAKDKDVDTSSGKCAQRFKSGWWYKNCSHANLNGLYLKGKHKLSYEGVNWHHWKGSYYSLKGTTMMVRRG